jgi:hypothetical protein
MSKDETATPTQRINIIDPHLPNPPWTGLYFDCQCGARHQLGAADECEPVVADNAPKGFDLWLAPPCWTCERQNIVATPVAGAVPS